MENLFAAIVPALSNDAAFCMLLAYAVSSEDIATFNDVLKERLSRASATPLPLCKDLFSDFVSFCSRDRYQHLIGPLKHANEERLSRRAQRAKMHKRIVYILGLNWKSTKRAARQAARFASAAHIYIPRLHDPYPPRGHWVADSQLIRSCWEYELQCGRLHDKRTGRHPMHIIDYTRLAINVLPGQDVFIYDAATRALICVVVRNFSCLPDPLAWADYIVQEAVDYRLPTRLDDPGTMVQVGFSAGSRSAPAFDWVRNLPKNADPEVSREINANVSAAFALFWNLCRFWLPDPVIDDIDNFMETTGIYPMDGNSRTGKLDGKYTIVAGDLEFEFTDARLAPPAGVVSQNYARAIHHEYQPHKWALSWTTARTCDDSYGGAFYLAAYGVRVANATNTLIAFMPVDFHGTSLPLCDPSASNPDYIQRGLAIATPNRLPKTWIDYQAGLISKAEAITTVYNDDDIIY
ncbi:hypothetical protein F5887DRAFT_1072859 [Amanita rubescens]|nr:hypothetical protein F5887DRAFT_1089336 [Amanita rubescens]KAF8326433.1 hypothetical protein F5887DRAFT_1084527 [Amanita rubescens]KAF8347341.1 hypothetical protein F5887DRAFT_1072859 [Amanita rubescens]